MSSQPIDTWDEPGPAVESIRDVRSHLAEVVDRADRDDVPTIITRHGRQVAAVVSVDVLRAYQRYQEEDDLRVIRERRRNSTPGVPMDQVIAEIVGDYDDHGHG